MLRHGVELLGLRQPLTHARFRPALAMNPELEAQYAANRLRVVRQVRYSAHNENALDLVLFINGLPVATVELRRDADQRRNPSLFHQPTEAGDEIVAQHHSQRDQGGAVGAFH